MLWLRREFQSDIRILRNDISGLRDGLQEYRFTTLDHKKQIESLAEGIEQTKEHIRSVDGRVVVLERRAGDESAVNRAVNKHWLHQAWRNFWTGAAGQVGAAFTLGIVALLLFILSEYFKKATP